MDMTTEALSITWAGIGSPLPRNIAMDQPAQQRSVRLQHPGLPDEIFQRDEVQSRQRMSATADEAEFLVADLLIREGSGIGIRRNAGDREVELALPQAVDQDGAGIDIDGDLKAGMPPPDRIDRRNDQFHRRRHHGPDRDLAAVPGLERRQFRPGDRQFGQDDAGMANHQLAVPVRLDALGVPLEQGKSQRILEIAEQLGRGGLGKVQAGGGAVKVPVLVKRQEKLKMTELQPGAEKPVGWQGLQGHLKIRVGSARIGIWIVIS